MDKDAPEWQDSAHEHGRQRTSEEALFGNLSGDEVGSDGSRNNVHFETRICSDERQRSLDEEPEAEKSQQSSERNSCRRTLDPENRVSKEENGE